MVAPRRYLKLLRGAFAGYPINRSVLSGDPTRPSFVERVLERLRLAETLEWIVHPNVVDRRNDCRDRLRIVILPVLVVLQYLTGPQESHRKSLRSRSIGVRGNNDQIERVTVAESDSCKMTHVTGRQAANAESLGERNN